MKRMTKSHFHGSRARSLSALVTQSLTNQDNELCSLHNVQFVKYDATVSFMAQVLDTVTYLVPQVLDTAS